MTDYWINAALGQKHQNWNQTQMKVSMYVRLTQSAHTDTSDDQQSQMIQTE